LNHIYSHSTRLCPLLCTHTGSPAAAWGHTQGQRAHGALRARAGLDRKAEFCILAGFLQHAWLSAICSPLDKMWGFRFGLGGSKADGSFFSPI